MSRLSSDELAALKFFEIAPGRMLSPLSEKLAKRDMISAVDAACPWGLYQLTDKGRAYLADVRGTRRPRPKIMVATPVRGAELSTALVTLGYADFRLELSKRHDVVTLVTFALDVVRARNRVVGQLLSDPAHADVTHVLWVDDDVYPARGAVVVDEMLAMLEELEEQRACSIVAAPYTSKRPPIHWTHRVSTERREVLGVGMGFTLMTRALLVTMGESPTTCWYTDLPRLTRTPNLFGQLEDHMVGPDGADHVVLLSEDYSFCKRAIDAGARIRLHLGAGVVHHAGGHGWTVHDIPPT